MSNIEEERVNAECSVEEYEPPIKNLAEALRITDQLRHFSQFNG